MVTGLYSGLCGLILLALTWRIILRRRRYKVGIGDGGIADLSQAIRVHGNFTETVPFLLLILLILELNGVSDTLLHYYGIILISARLLHAYGITQSPLLSFGRKYGVLITLFLILAGSAALIIMSMIKYFAIL